MVQSHAALDEPFQITEQIFNDRGHLLSLVPTVYHISHRTDARAIVRERKLRAGLIYDESRLNQTRTCVTWLSPTRFPSFIYGHVRFSFPVAALLENKKLYWVEWMEYVPWAPRILVSSQEVTHLELQEIDITQFGGPLYGTPTQLLRFDQFNYEFMFAENISLDLCEAIDIVSHENPRRYCSKWGQLKYCQEPSEDKARLQMISHALLWPTSILKNRLELDHLDISVFARDLVTWLLTPAEGIVVELLPNKQLFRLALLALSDGYFDIARESLLMYGELRRILAAFVSHVRRVFGLDVARTFLTAIKRTLRRIPVAPVAE